MAKRIACAICGGRSLWWDQWPGLPLGTRWDLYYCSQDEVLSLVAGGDSQPEVDQVDFHARKFAGYAPQEMQCKSRDFKSVVDELRPWLGDGGAPVHELGAGRGAMTAALRRAGFPGESSEPSARMVAQARADFGPDHGDVRRASALEHLAAIGDASAGAVILWHVLEHLDAPLEVAREARRVLIPGGSLILQLPMIAPEGLFAAHSFVVLPRFPEAFGRRLGMSVAYVNVDLRRLFLTLVLSNKPVSTVDRRPPELPLAGLPGDAAVWLAGSRLQDPMLQNEVPE